MKTYTIYNHANKSVVYDQKTGTPENGFRDMKILTFKTRKAAEQWKDEDLASGNYYDHPHTVYEIREHGENKSEKITPRQALIVLLIIFMAFLHALTGNAQTIKQDSTGNFVMVHKAKSEDKPTGKTLTLTDGTKLPIYISEHGKYYVLRQSKKTNKIYKQYLTL